MKKIILVLLLLSSLFLVGCNSYQQHQFCEVTHNERFCVAECVEEYCDRGECICVDTVWNLKLS